MLCSYLVFGVSCLSLYVACWLYVFDVCCCRLSCVGVGLCYLLFVVRCGLLFLVVCCVHDVLRELCLNACCGVLFVVVRCY